MYPSALGLKQYEKLKKSITNIISKEQLHEWAKKNFVTSHSLLKNNSSIIEDIYLFDEEVLLKEIKEELIIKNKRIKTDVIAFNLDLCTTKNIPKILIPMLNDVYEFNYQKFPPCVYFLVYDDNIVYVGETIYLSTRIDAHKKEKIFDSVFYIPVIKQELKRVEKAIIKYLKPKYNNEPFVHCDLTMDDKKIINEKFNIK